MAKAFEPRKVLKQIANPLLREFFSRRGELGEVPWDTLTEHQIEPVFEAWQALAEEKKLEVQVILRDVNELADHRGLAVLAEAILDHCPQCAEEFKAQQGIRAELEALGGVVEQTAGAVHATLASPFHSNPGKNLVNVTDNP